MPPLASNAGAPQSPSASCAARRHACRRALAFALLVSAALALHGCGDPPQERNEYQPRLEQPPAEVVCGEDVLLHELKPGKSGSGQWRSAHKCTVDFHTGLEFDGMCGNYGLKGYCHDGMRDEMCCCYEDAVRKRLRFTRMRLFKGSAFNCAPQGVSDMSLAQLSGRTLPRVGEPVGGSAPAAASAVLDLGGAVVAPATRVGTDVDASDPQKVAQVTELGASRFDAAADGAAQPSPSAASDIGRLGAAEATERGESKLGTSAQVSARPLPAGGMVDEVRDVEADEIRGAGSAVIAAASGHTAEERAASSAGRSERTPKIVDDTADALASGAAAADVDGGVATVLIALEHLNASGEGLQTSLAEVTDFGADRADASADGAALAPLVGRDEVGGEDAKATVGGGDGVPGTVAVEVRQLGGARFDASAGVARGMSLSAEVFADGSDAAGKAQAAWVRDHDDSRFNHDGRFNAYPRDAWGPLPSGARHEGVRDDSPPRGAARGSHDVAGERPPVSRHPAVAGAPPSTHSHRGGAGGSGSMDKRGLHSAALSPSGAIVVSSAARA